MTIIERLKTSPVKYCKCGHAEITHWDLSTTEPKRGACLRSDCTCSNFVEKYTLKR